MDKDLDVLESTPLFEGFTKAELRALLDGLHTMRRQYGRGETLLQAGEDTQEFGVVLSGEIEAYKATRGGRRFTVSRMGAGGVFGDVLSGGAATSPVTVSTPTGCEVVRIAYPSLFAPGGEGELKKRLLANLVRVVSDKYFALDRRMDLLLVPRLRRRIAAYLLEEARRQGSVTFRVPFKRAGLADYLGCERSALSRELSRMASEELIETYRSTFRILDEEALVRLV